MNPDVLYACLAGYLLGSIPFGLLIHRLSGRGDIRAQGSGNIGATNVLRSGGTAAGVATLLLDAGKGVAATLAAGAIAVGPDGAPLAAFAAVVGHCHPIWLRFRGGKGVATACGAYFPLAPIPMALALAVFAVLTLATRIVSIGSLGAGIALPLLVAWRDPSRALLLSVIASLALVVARHRENIVRRARGRERAFGSSRRDDA